MSKGIAPVNPSKPDKKKTPDDWEIKSAHETLVKAEEIKNDPHMMKHVMKHHKKASKAIKSIDDLRAAREEMGESKEEEAAEGKEE